MEVRMDGRSAIITGASKGLGLAMAQKFAEAGADVAILARGADGLAEAKAEVSRTARGRVETFGCDVSDAAQIAATFAKVQAAFGKVDILVNNAGASRTGPFESLTDEIWQEDLNLKLFAAIRFCRLVLPGMKARKWGRIINVLNIGAKVPLAERAPTSISRAAGMSLTKTLANEYARHNILVNALLVGLFSTEQTRRNHRQSGGTVPFEEYAAKLGAKLPLGRLGNPVEFANIACLLASDAGSYITGTAINVDGGSCPVV